MVLCWDFGILGHRAAPLARCVTVKSMLSKGVEHCLVSMVISFGRNGMSVYGCNYVYIYRINMLHARDVDIVAPTLSLFRPAIT